MKNTTRLHYYEWQSATPTALRKLVNARLTMNDVGGAIALFEQLFQLCPHDPADAALLIEMRRQVSDQRIGASN